MKYVHLNTGTQMPMLGFGVYQIPREDTRRAVSEAIAIGYRHIDTAQYYRNEAGVGQAVRESGFPRQEFFITTKVGTSGYKETKKQVERALKNLQTDYIDLMLIHWVVSDYEGTYQALEEAYHEGKLKAIGLSNFQPELIEHLKKRAEVKPAVLQNEMHVLQQQVDTRAYCQANSIQFESWAPFGEGRQDIFNHPVLTEIRLKYSKTAAQVILRFILQEGVVAIPKTSHKDRMAENFAVFDFNLTENDLQTIRQLDQQKGLFGWNG
ncbi:aldo/keto reductase [Streptococcus macacae]|uniref:Oxidoreductase, aldo/keto reductase family protein n=1 Tax=Streptococcus macacae NCTC 11558 TaxID=764298 RepID=G5JWL8_9STRE|nr:aldo/keto reductase [Streptococcus macacae]EHJ52275.1 oxidoreductase, aldo/keto reductase family protein [Streptococcus macacae NCTC 11558]SUN78807.1 aldo/keto reductase family protein [Streptococcus macacae NCTC 11558]